MKKSNKAQIKTTIAAKVILDLMKRRQADLSVETVEVLETIFHRLIDASKEGFETVDLQDFMAELTDTIVDGQ